MMHQSLRLNTAAVVQNCDIKYSSVHLFSHDDAFNFTVIDLMSILPLHHVTRRLRRRRGVVASRGANLAILWSSP